VFSQINLKNQATSAVHDQNTLQSQETEPHLQSKVEHLTQSATPIDISHTNKTLPAPSIPQSTSPYTTNEHILSIYSDNTKIPLFQKRKLVIQTAKIINRNKNTRMYD